jgi:methyl-accepting chemotaxis protein/methyl-accepting chemotaxis protein-1 (serine sensor receptor)
MAHTKHKEMITSMKGIKSASDEIVFQTDILALNAALEAASAGKAGEVRDIVERSARAAKDTAAMIEESISKSSEAGARKAPGPAKN